MPHDSSMHLYEFGFMPGQTVVDLGSGSGGYSFHLGNVLGHDGTVIAVDIDEHALRKLFSRAQNGGFQNVHPLQGDIESRFGTNVAPDHAHGAVFAHSLSQTKERGEALKEAKRIVRSGGTIVIIEEKEKLYLPRSLRSNYFLSQDETKELAKQTGLSFIREFSAGEYSYGLIFRK